MKSCSGLSFIELATCLAIVAILAAVAVPGYQPQLRRARRFDAQHSLLTVQALQQRFRFDYGRYASGLSELDASGSLALSPQGYYLLELRGDGAGWVALATPTNQSQSANAPCRTFTLDDAGRRGATGSADAPRRCWK